MPGYRIPKAAFKSQQSYEKYICLSCDHLLRNAVQSALCGHWFCEPCIVDLLKKSDPICPSCGDGLKSEEDPDGTGYFPDKFVRRDIDSLEMFCVYQDSGCKWEGTFAKLEAHLSNCEFAKCGKCGGRLGAEAGEHKCSNISEMTHQCPLEPLGCNAGTIENMDKLTEHMQEAQISHMTTLTSRITRLETTVGVGAQAPIHSFQPVEADGSYRLDSGLGQSLGSSHFGEEAERDNANIIRKSASTLGSRDKAMHFNGGTPMTAGTQAQMQLKQEVDMLRKELKLKTDEIIGLKASVSKLEKNQRSKNADFEDRDFRLSLIENSNYDGTMVWKIPQFTQRMTDAQSGKYTSIFSLPFYTGRYGYKMCLRLYILGDGIGKGSYMSLFFVLMKGEFDNILHWPFTHKVTFKLLNQSTGKDIVDTFQPDPMSSSFRKPKSDMNIASGCPRFVSHTDLQGGGYIFDDTVFIKCVVDTGTIRHP